MASTDITLVIQAVDKATAELASVTSKIESLKAESEALAAANVALASAQRSAAAAMRATASESEKNVDAIADMRDEISSAKNAYENLEKASLKASASEQAENKVILGDLGRRIDGMKEAIRVARKLEGMGFNKKQVDAATASVREFNAAQAKAATTLETTKVSTEKGTESLKNFAIRGAVIITLMKKMSNASQEFGSITDSAMKLAGQGFDALMRGLGTHDFGKMLVSASSVNDVSVQVLAIREQIEALDRVINGVTARTYTKTVDFKEGTRAVLVHEEAVRAATGQRLQDAKAIRGELSKQLTLLNDMQRVGGVLGDDAAAESLAAGAKALSDARSAQKKVTEETAKATLDLAAAEEKYKNEVISTLKARDEGFAKANAAAAAELAATRDDVANAERARTGRENAAAEIAHLQRVARLIDERAGRTRKAFAEISEAVRDFVTETGDAISDAISDAMALPEHWAAQTDSLNLARENVAQLERTMRMAGAAGEMLGDELRDARIRVVAEEMALLANASNDGAINVDALSRALSQMEAKKDGLVEIKKGLLDISDVASSVGDHFADAFMSIIDGTESVGDAVRKMIAGILRDLVRVFITRAIMNAIMGQQQPMFSGFQHGGAVVAGAPILVGERGPELFVPKQSGYVNNAAASRGGGGVTVNFQISAVDGPSVQAMLLREADTIKNVVASAAQRDHRFRASMN